MSSVATPYERARAMAAQAIARLRTFDADWCASELAAALRYTILRGHNGDLDGIAGEIRGALMRWRDAQDSEVGAYYAKLAWERISALARAKERLRVRWRGHLAARGRVAQDAGPAVDDPQLGRILVRIDENRRRLRHARREYRYAEFGDRRRLLERRIQQLETAMRDDEERIRVIRQQRRQRGGLRA